MINENTKSNLANVLSHLTLMANNVTNEENHSFLLDMFAKATNDIYNDDPEVQQCMRDIIKTLRENNLKSFSEKQTEELFDTYPSAVTNSAILNMREILQIIRRIVDNSK